MTNRERNAKMFEVFDGTGRQPRQVQIDALNFIRPQIGNTKFIAVEAKTGSGKSAIARALQLEFGGHVIVPSNHLIDQYMSDYEALGARLFRGRKHYKCVGHNYGTCEDRITSCKSSDACPYKKAKSEASRGTPYFVNVASYNVLGLPSKSIPLLVVDEAHRLLDLVEIEPELSVPRWSKALPADSSHLKGWITDYQRYHDERKPSEKSESYREWAKQSHDIADVLGLFDSVTYKAQYNPTTRETEIRRVEYRTDIIDAMFEAAETVVLLSATLPQFIVSRILAGKRCAYRSLDNPIAPSRRPVKMDYQDFNYKTDPEMIADWIRSQREIYKNPNTIVHVTYSMAKQLSQLMPEAHVHLSVREKNATMANFVEKGGIWLAPGAAEGVNLKYDQARLNLIPVVPFLNLGDEIVKARRSRFGATWYDQCTLLTLIQMVGRTTRAADDSSMTVIGDVRAVSLLSKHQKAIGNDFFKTVEF